MYGQYPQYIYGNSTYQVAKMLKLSFFFDNFLAIVRTAFLANSVREHEFSALGALYDAGKAKLPVV